MTVIAWDGKTLAADKMLSNATYKYKINKLFRLNDGSIGGWAGYPHQALKVIGWLNSDRNPEKYPDQTDEERSAVVMIITKKKKVYLFNDMMAPCAIEEKQIAIGSGDAYAKTAMFMGYDAESAVFVASKLCPSCGSGIDTMVL